MLTVSLGRVASTGQEVGGWGEGTQCTGAWTEGSRRFSTGMSRLWLIGLLLWVIHSGVWGQELDSCLLSCWVVVRRTSKKLGGVDMWEVGGVVKAAGDGDQCRAELDA